MAAAVAACMGRARLKAVGARARAERTSNILRMSVTLDVSKMSGWLNALADCRVERRGCEVGRGAAREARGRGATAAKAACTGRAPTQGWGG